ncbi:MAG: hypothetical protein R3324_00465 [Halobacteriales archaeon]|nr:hypothetical protein [Halobacteriales archaeon]
MNFDEAYAREKRRHRRVGYLIWFVGVVIAGRVLPDGERWAIVWLYFCVLSLVSIHAYGERRAIRAAMRIAYGAHGMEPPVRKPTPGRGKMIFGALAWIALFALSFLAW